MRFGSSSTCVNRCSSICTTLIFVWVLAHFIKPSGTYLLPERVPKHANYLRYLKQQVFHDGSSERSRAKVTDERLLDSDLQGRDAVFSTLFDALEVMQSHYFEVWQGTWPKAIDWTAAVLATHVSASLSALSTFEGNRLTSMTFPGQSSTAEVEQMHRQENAINRYFTQITSYYFGEDAFSLRLQAYDDMLWVVLGWLEAIKFINLHSTFPSNFSVKDSGSQMMAKTPTWYGQQFISQFAHRAHVFYDLASKGWNTSLCSGGMIWSPYLVPYKNAVTNQLFIAASVGMYLYLPGDDNSSPFIDGTESSSQALPPAKARDPNYLQAAVEAYRWLRKSGMTNAQGLYVDGFHIAGWRGGRNGSSGSGKCDIRDEQVYTYNQGVLLSGLRGLWEATGARRYLEDGHELIHHVIAATGWNRRDRTESKSYAGIGRAGVLEEACDSAGTCSQDGQTFKGVFFHHLALFCAPTIPEHGNGADMTVVKYHQRKCQGYAPWVRHNARAACVTRDDQGRFGSWWGRPYRPHADAEGDRENQGLDNPPTRGADYRNNGIPNNGLWRFPDDPALHPDVGSTAASGSGYGEFPAQRRPWDLNDRGRGRTVESQSGGVAVLRALWQIAEQAP